MQKISPYCKVKSVEQTLTSANQQTLHSDFRASNNYKYLHDTLYDFTDHDCNNVKMSAVMLHFI